MTEREIQVLNSACQMTGIDASKITAENPATKSGKTAQMLMMAASEIDPEQAAMWRQAAPGGQLSVATLSELQAVKHGGQLSAKAAEELWAKDPTFVRRELVAREEKRVADEAAWERAYQEKRLKNKAHQMGGDVERAREVLRQEDEIEAQRQQQRIESEQHAAALNQRLEKRRQDDARMAGRLF